MQTSFGQDLLAADNADPLYKQLPFITVLLLAADADIDENASSLSKVRTGCYITCYIR